MPFAELYGRHFKVNIAECRPEIRVMSLPCPVNTGENKRRDIYLSYVYVYRMFQFKITKFRGIFQRVIISSFKLFASAVYTQIWHSENLVYRLTHSRRRLFKRF